MRKLIPLIVALFGIVGGVGAGFLLRHAAPDETVIANNCIQPEGSTHAQTAPERDETLVGNSRREPDASTLEYVKLNNQFVIPVIAEARISSLVVLSLSLEVSVGKSDLVYQREPKLRDSFLQVLFDHANVGGFQGAFTESSKLDPLRRLLLKAATDSLGGLVTDVLITEIARQDA